MTESYTFIDVAGWGYFCGRFEDPRSVGFLRPSWAAARGSLPAPRLSPGARIASSARTGAVERRDAASGEGRARRGGAGRDEGSAATVRARADAAPPQRGDRSDAGTERSEGFAGERREQGERAARSANSERGAAR